MLLYQLQGPKYNFRSISLCAYYPINMSLSRFFQVKPSYHIQLKELVSMNAIPFVK